jgi:hypothetical protein
MSGSCLDKAWLEEHPEFLVAGKAGLPKGDRAHAAALSSSLPSRFSRPASWIVLPVPISSANRAVGRVLKNSIPAR